MKLSIYTFIFVMCLLIVPASATNFTFHPDNIMYLTMNGTSGSTSFSDLSPNGHTMITHGNAQVSSLHPYFYNTAVFSSATSDYISADYANDLNFGNNNWFISTKCYFTSLPTVGNEVTIWSEILSTSDFMRLNLYNDAGSYKFYFYVLNGSSVVNTYGTSISSGVSINNYYQIDTIKSGSNTNIYINGLSVSSSSSAYTIPDFKVPFNINGAVSGNFANVYLDDFFIFNGVGSPSSDVVTTREFISNPISSGFTTNPSSGTSPLSVQFTNITNDAVSSHLWTFKKTDGNNTEIQFSTSANPSKIFDSGLFTMNYTVSNPLGYSTAYSQINSSATPQVVSNFTYFPDTLYVGGTILFYDRSDDAPNLWYWNFGDGSTAYVQNPIHSYSSAGTYNVTMSASNSGASNNSISKNLIVHGMQDHDPIVVTNPYVVVYMWQRIS